MVVVHRAYIVLDPLVTAESIQNPKRHQSQNTPHILGKDAVALLTPQGGSHLHGFAMAAEHICRCQNASRRIQRVDSKAPESAGRVPD